MKPKILVLLSLGLAFHAQAGSATWNLNPTSGDWNTAANWTPATVPNGATQVAQFDVSNGTNVSLSSPVTVAAIAFSPTASAFSFTTNLLNLEFEGAGVMNQSPVTQQFQVPVGSAGGHGMIEFFNRATAGSATAYTVEGSTANGQAGGTMNFWDESSAGSAAIDLRGGAHGTFTIGGRAAFMDSSTAGEANITVEPGEDLNFAAGLADVAFYDNSGAGHATLNAKGSVEVETFAGLVIFLDESSAEDATIIADGDPRVSAGGDIEFVDSSTGGRARVQLFGRGSLLIFLRTTPSVTIGSLEGDGNVSIEKTNELVVGSNNASTTFRGPITGTGSLVKIGSGALNLKGTSTYTGGTTVSAGKLIVTNSTGSATGTGPVQVNAGKLGGRGIIAGATTVGTGSGTGATLLPEMGSPRQVTLTFQDTLTFNADATYGYFVNSENGLADKVIANGVTLGTGAQFTLRDRGEVFLPPGTVFTALSNTSANPIAGTFANLPDGAVLTVGNNTFQTDYEGGDGNDLTLTVMP